MNKVYNILYFLGRGN